MASLTEMFSQSGKASPENTPQNLPRIKADDPQALEKLSEIEAASTERNPTRGNQQQIGGNQTASQELSRAIVESREEIPADDFRTPPGTPAPSEIKETGGFFQKLGDVLDRPGTQKLLSQLGMSISPQGTPGRTLGQFGVRQAESNAQNALMRRLESGQNVEEALQADDVRGISGEGAQRVVNQVRSRQAQRREQDLQERQVDQAGERLDLRGEELNLRERSQRIQTELDRRRLDQQGERIDLQRQAQQLEEEQQAIERAAQEYQNELTQARTRLTKARAAQLGAGEGGGFNMDSLKRVTDVASTASSLAESVRKRAQEIQAGNFGGRRQVVVSEGTFFDETESVENLAQQVRDKVNQGMSRQEAINSLPAGQAEVRSYLETQDRVQSLNDTAEQLEDTANQAFDMVFQQFGGGQQNTDSEQPTDDEGRVEVSSREEAMNLPSGTKFILNGRKGTVQ
jgi:hypothetical protein